MIQLHPDYLMFQTSSGEAIPCSAEMVTLELMGEAAAEVDPEIIRQAAASVLFYFKTELGRSFVSVDEFSKALEKVLRGFGFTVHSSPPSGQSLRVGEADLRQLAFASGRGFELAFFTRLRDELRQQLKSSPECVRFQGLRSSVKLLNGAKRWNSSCQELSDRIVDFLRHCLETEEAHPSCPMMIR